MIKPRKIPFSDAEGIILASNSETRAGILRNAGVRFVQQRSTIDEQQLQREWSEISPSRLAKRLAQAKALDVGARFPHHIIIGADQTLELTGGTLHKVMSLQQAKERLLTLAGCTHKLHTSVACAVGKEITFVHNTTATLTMHSLGDSEIETYLSAEGEAALFSAGCYLFEARGIQLFKEVRGDFHSILGLPLLRLLAFLRKAGMIPQ